MQPFWTQEEIGILLKGGNLKKFPKGQIIFSEGDRTNDVYFIEKGWINVFRMTQDGKRVSIALRNRGEFIGISEIFRTEPRDCYAEALEKVEVFAIGVDYINGVLSEHPEVLRKCLTLLSYRLHESHTTLLDFVCNKAAKRMALTISHLANNSSLKENGKVIVSLKITQEELAAIIGSSRQVVSGLLKSLKEAGCIEMLGRQIEAVYPEKLNSWLSTVSKE